MYYLTALAILILSAGSIINDSIITRHDRSDEAYLNFARELPVTATIARYNTTDVAGTLVAPRWILSAAHVAETIKKDHKLILDCDSLEVDTVIIHPGWLENGRPEDIALIKLKRSIIDVTPAGLYGNRNEVGKMVIVAGIGDFGTGLSGPEGNDGRLRAATNSVDRVTDEYLVWKFDDPREKPEKVTRLEGISGPGDSSGPAFIQTDAEGGYLIAGISSAQSTNATGGREGLSGVTEYYTRVSTYADWIVKTISD